MNYPKEIKAFYMRLNDDGRTVAAMDVLAPGIGEIIGGSQREERLDVLDARMTEAGLDREHYGWYRDLRRYGTVPHAGFGLGFERTVAYVTGPRERARRHPVPADAGQRTVLTWCAATRGAPTIALQAAGTSPAKIPRADSEPSWFVSSSWSKMRFAGLSAAAAPFAVALASSRGSHPRGAIVLSSPLRSKVRSSPHPALSRLLALVDVYGTAGVGAVVDDPVPPLSRCRLRRRRRSPTGQSPEAINARNPRRCC